MSMPIININFFKTSLKRKVFNFGLLKVTYSMKLFQSAGVVI